MHTHCRIGLVVAVLASGMAVACGKSPAAPSLTSVDPTTILLFDNFDSENGGNGVFNWQNYANWNVLSGCADLHGNGLFDVQPGNGLYMDLDGSCAQGAIVESKTAFALDPGTYVFEFFLAGNNRISSPDTVIVSLGTLYEEQFVLQQRDRFQLRTRTVNVTSATTARIRFQNLGADGRGGLVDLVRLRRAS